MSWVSKSIWKCTCGVHVFCQEEVACRKQCSQKCAGGIGYSPFIENSIGDLKDSYPPSVKKLWDDIVYNQPPNYNYALAQSNQVDYTNSMQGLVHDHIFPTSDWDAR